VSGTLEKRGIIALELLKTKESASRTAENKENTSVTAEKQGKITL
jgi:hypothetical protein